MLARAAWKAIKSVDMRRVSLPEWDVFHSTFLPLPSPAVTGRAQRVMSVYDVIPLTDPESAQNLDLRAQSLALLDSIQDGDHVLVNSAFVAREVHRIRSIDTTHIHIVPLAASERYATATPADVRAARRFAGVPDAPYVLTVANAQPRKDLPLLIRAFGHLAATHRNASAHLVLVGGDWLDASSTHAALAEHRALGPRIHRLDYVPEHLFPGLYAGASAFVFPSRAEGFGLPLVEAMKAGVPVLATDASTSPEILAGAGIIVGQESSLELANELASLLQDPSHAAEYAARSVQRARDFTWASSAKMIGDLYLQLAR